MKEQNLYIVLGVVLVMLLYIVSSRRSVCEDFTDDPGLMKQISDAEAQINKINNLPLVSDSDKAGFIRDTGVQKGLDMLIKKRDDARAAGVVAESKATTLATSAVPISSTSAETPNTYSASPASSIDMSKLMSMATQFTAPPAIPTSTTPTPKPQEDTLSSVTSVLGSGLSLGALIGIIVAVLAVGIIALVSVLNITGLSSLFPKDSLPLSPIPPPPSF